MKSKLIDIIKEYWLSKYCMASTSGAGHLAICYLLLVARITRINNYVLNTRFKISLYNTFKQYNATCMVKTL